MADHLQFIGDTPFSKDHHSAREQSRTCGSKGLKVLQQRRGKAADDMSNKGVGDSILGFCDELFPTPTDPEKLAMKPTLDSNPFASLENADGLRESELTEKFVSVPSLVS